MTKIIRRSFFLLCAIAAATCSQAFAHPGGITTPDPSLPPEGEYLTPSDVHATYSQGALTVVLSAIQHQPFALLNPNDFDCGSAGTPGQCEHHEFGSGLSADVELFMNGNPAGSGQIKMTGPVETIALGRSASNQPGVFPTEMLSMQLTGMFGTQQVMVRESPTKQSLGQTSIIPQGGGLYHIDSFFDVFTELSLQGGVDGSWIPQNELLGSHVYLSPEPTSAILLALGLMGFAGFTRRR